MQLMDRPPPGTLSLERQPGRLLALPLSAGRADVAETAVAELVQRASVTGLAVGRCSIRPASTDPKDGVDVTVEAVADYGSDAAVAAEQVRRTTISAIGASVGLRVRRVDVQVVDVDVSTMREEEHGDG